MNDYGRDRYLEETPAESAERERAQILDARAKTLAGVMIDNQDDCEITGVTLSKVIGSLDDYNEFDKLVFGAANGCEASCRLLKEMLEKKAAELILDELEAIEDEHEWASRRIVQRRAAKFWGERP